MGVDVGGQNGAVGEPPLVEGEGSRAGVVGEEKGAA